MNCRNIRSELHQLADGSLSDDRAVVIYEHLAACPLCRIEMSALKSLRSELGSLPKPELGVGALTRLRSLIASEVSTGHGYPTFQLIEGNGNWWKRWFMPTTVGTFASAILGIALLGVILIPSNVPQLASEPSDNLQNSDPLYLANIDPVLGDQFITPQQFARSRGDVSPESPSLNPGGTLVDMANSIAPSLGRDDEVVVVADVYRDGEARITDVVESSRDKRKMERLHAAFRADRIAPPFVPANLDNRNDVVRVILKFQNVNVNIDADNSFR
jgi:hypothetical protein